MERRDAARQLYMEGWQQNDIARVLKVTEKTVSGWSTEEGWKDKRIQYDLMEESSTQMVMELIEYQLKALKRRVKAWTDENPESTKLIERGDIDALQKLHTTIKREHMKWSHIVIVCKELLEYVSVSDVELAKSLTEKIDNFLNEKRRLI